MLQFCPNMSKSLEKSLFWPIKPCISPLSRKMHTLKMPFVPVFYLKYFGTFFLLIRHIAPQKEGKRKVKGELWNLKRCSLLYKTISILKQELLGGKSYEVDSNLPHMVLILGMWAFIWPWSRFPLLYSFSHNFAKQSNQFSEAFGFNIE